jgi:hypothetical protein
VTDFLAAKVSIASMWKRLLGQGVTQKLGAWQSYRQRPADFSLTGAVGHSLYILTGPHQMKRAAILYRAVGASRRESAR